MPKSLPTLPITCNASEFAEVYARTRAVLLRGGGEHAERHFGLEDLRRLPAHSELLRDAGETFTVENAPIRVADFVDGRGKRKHAPEDATAAVFGPRTASELLDSACALPGAWYASCVLGREPAAIDALLRAVPLAVPPSLAGAHARHSRAVWIFIGRNDASAPLPGRPEHTDSVQHDGTWHYQAEGVKEWRLRPTDELLASAPPGTLPSRCRVLCERGDVLVISTRDWWHATSLPPQTNESKVSLSYAREFRLGGAAAEGQKRKRKQEEMMGGEEEKEEVEEEKGKEKEEDDDEEKPRASVDEGDYEDDDTLQMGNVDGLCAGMAIKAGEIVLRAAQMPDCTLPMGEVYNVQAERVRVRTTVGGRSKREQVLIATRDIKSGEALILPPAELQESLAEEDSDADEEQEEEDEDDEQEGKVEGEDGEDGEGSDEDDEQEGKVEGEDGEDGEGSDEDEDEDDDVEEEAVVQCDGRKCRKEMSSLDEIVFTSRFGQDYCMACVATFSDLRREGLTRSTVAERLQAVREEP